MANVKDKIFEQLHDIGIGIIRRFDPKFEIYSIDSKFLYIRTANAKQMKDGTKKYWYGIPKPIIDKYNEFGGLFILLIMDKGENVILIPAGDFVNIIHGIEPDIDNRWKPYLFLMENKATLKLKGREIDITRYLNNFKILSEYIPMPVIREKIVERPPKIKEIEKTLGEKMIEYSTKGEFHIEFEKVVFNALQNLGFKCEWVSEGRKSGITDIFIKEPYRAIVDPKSRTSGTISEINFTRIKGHKEAKNAKYMIVVGYDFDPAVVSDAKREEACLLSSPLFKRILDLNEIFALTPYSVENIISTKGLVAESKIENLENRVNESLEFVKDIAAIIEELESPMTIDTLHGIIKTKEKYEGRRQMSRDEIKMMVEMLMTPPLSIIKCENNKYCRIKDLINARRVIVSLGKSLSISTPKGEVSKKIQ